jgi:hypothetical protein
MPLQRHAAQPEPVGAGSRVAAPVTPAIEDLWSTPLDFGTALSRT